LGRTLAIAFAKAGYSIALNYAKSETQAQEAAHEIRNLGVEVITLRADVSSPEQVNKMFDDVKLRWGRVDVLVNNAGITHNRTIAKMTDAEWREVMNVVLDGSFFCTRAALPMMREQKGGVIINIGSYVAADGVRGAANYAAAKAGLVALTKTTAIEEGRNNIRANVVMPGFHITDMNREVYEKLGADIMKQHLLGRLPDQIEMANFVVSIAKLSSVTGQVFAFESRV
jgi:NAD(P)-dependent dehydrogenase (short-subunit alcohol dehydrogenase family)